MRFAKPIDGKLILESLQKSRNFYTIEEHVLTGGFGSKVLEYLEANSIFDVRIHRFALPDQFIEHGTREIILEQLGLSAEKMADRIAHDLRSQKIEPVFHAS